MARDTLMPVQCQMARAGLGLGVRDLAKLARVSPTTITRLERGHALLPDTLADIREALENAGALFPGNIVFAAVAIKAHLK